MEHETLILLTVLKGITVAFGAAFLGITLRAYLKHRARSMLALLVAIGLMTFAAVAEGFSLQFLGLNLDAAHTIEAVFTLAGFIVLVLSVVTHRLD